jgi:two-component system, LuxR family, sensor kinase FixL
MPHSEIANRAAPHAPSAIQSSDSVTMFGFAAALIQQISDPVSALAGEVEAICSADRDDPLTEQARCEAFARISSIADRTSAYLVQAQTMLRATNEWKPLEIDAMIRDVAMRIAAAPFGSGIEFTLRLPPDMPKIAANRSQIDRLLWEVMRNAAEAMADISGRKLLVVECAIVDGELEIAVSDQGPGCADAEAIFTLFASGKTGHAGIGLNIARAFANANGGQLRARHGGNGRNGCLRVIFTLPLH